MELAIWACVLICAGVLWVLWATNQNLREVLLQIHDRLLEQSIASQEVLKCQREGVEISESVIRHVLERDRISEERFQHAAESRKSTMNQMVETLRESIDETKRERLELQVQIDELRDSLKAR